jgi:hypothetical protein
MRKVGLLAFGVTSLVLVPTMLHSITAGPQQIAKLVAPGESSIELGGAKVQVAVDRPIVDAGDVVHVRLSATAPKAAKVSAAVLVLESLGTYNGRVEQPPERVTLETVALDAAPGGGAAKELAVKLPGLRRTSEMQLGHYTILVMEPKAAARLDRLRQAARREGAAPGFNPMESAAPKQGAFNEMYYGLSGDGGGADDEGGKAATAARVDVMTRPAKSAVAIRAPEQAAVGQEISVVVQVTNPTKRRIPELTVQLQQPELYQDYRGLDFEQVSLANESASVALAPRETKQVEFRLTAKQAGILGLYASISCDECQYDARLYDGNLEAIEIVEAPKAAAPVAAAR